MTHLILPDLAATEALAARLVRLAKPGDAILLDGPLGAGKSAFARAFLRAAADDPELEVPSPTYTLVQSYPTQLGPVHHFDLWRLEGEEGVLELGWDELSQDIVLVEWPERLGRLSPPGALEIAIHIEDGEQRIATLSGWDDRVLTSNSPIIPTHAMLLAAGLGARMRPLSNDTPKPLLALGGKPILDHAIDRLADAGVQHLVVNTHYLAEQIEAHLSGHAAPPEIVFSREDALLETGGGVRHALELLGDQPFFVVNGDALWLDGPTPALSRLQNAWEDDIDVLLLLHRTFQVHAEVRQGDFALDPWGKPRRPNEREIVPYIYAGIQLLRPSALASFEPGRFSMNHVWDKALADGRLKAIVHDGLWFHLSTPEDVIEAEAALYDAVVGTTT